MLIPVQLMRDQPLQRQLYEQLRALIETSRLLPGTRMPSTRMMAEQFAISRITVLLTYERLIAEGFLETRPAKGTYVSAPPKPQAVPAPIRLAAASEPPAVTNGVGLPDPALFPAGRWRALMRAALDRLGAQVRTPHPAGSPSLRHAITHWLSSSRGVSVTPEQIMVFNSRQQALHFVAHLLLPRGGRVVVEGPCDQPTSSVLAGDGVALERVAVDAQGLCPQRLPEGEVSLIHVTPEHQRQLGVALSHGRRLALLAWAERAGAVVLEEDGDGELRYGDLHAAPSLMTLDSAERVILLGGFAASLGPWLHTAYLALPERLVPEALAIRRLLDDGNSVLEDNALAELLHSGLYARHLHQLSRIYAGRRDALIHALAQHFGPSQAVWGTQAGLHLAWFPPAELGAAAGVAGQARGCGLESGFVHGTAEHGPALQLGFGQLPEDRLGARVAQLAARCAHSAMAAD